MIQYPEVISLINAGSIPTMSGGQESEELLSDTLEPQLEGVLEFSENVTSMYETTTILEGAPLRKTLIAKIKRSWLFQEMVTIVKLSVPIIFMYFLQELSFFLLLLLIGRSSSKTELDAVAVASTVVNVTGLSVVVGLMSAADTLCPQAYGFKNYRRVGIILQRGILIVGLVCLPIAALWLNTESILLLLHQPPCVARLAGKFVQVFIPALLPMVIEVMIQKYLQAQSLVWVFVVVGIFQNIINVLVAALFIYVGDIVIVGSSISLVISYMVTTVIAVGYVWGRGLHKQTWKGWSWDSLTEWSLFFKLGIPGLLMECFEWWTFEISTIVAGAVDELQLAVNTILMQFGLISFAIPLGIGTVACVRVGNELGAGNPQKAKRAAFAALVVQAIIAFVMLLVFAGSRTAIAQIFTSQQDIIQETAKAMIPGTAVFFFDQFQGTFAGIIRGSGRQKIGALMNFVFYYLIGLPVGISLALLTDLGATGMWTGLSIAVFLTDVTYVIIMLTTDWEKMSELAMKNAGSSKESYPSSTSGTSDSSYSIKSTEMADMELDAESAATRELIQADDREEKDCASDEEEAAPLISSEEVTEHLESTDKCHSQVKGGSRVCRANSKFKLFLSKALLCALGVLLFAVGCVLLVSFPHSEVDEMCSLDNEYYATNGTSTSTSYSTVSITSPASNVVLTSALPSPSSTLTDQFQTSTSF